MNKEIIIEIKRLGINGEGIGYINKKAVFVDLVLPGEEVKIEITKEYPTYLNAKLIEIIKPSKHRIEPFCPVYNECGGCQLQHLSYKEQLNLKRELIIGALKRYTKGAVKFGLVKDTIGMDNNTHYRNKASLPVMFQNGKTTVGMYKPGSNHLVGFDACPVQNDDINKVYRLILNQMEKRKIEAFNHGGIVRYIIVRKTHHLGETQVTFVVTERDEKIKSLAKYLVDKFKEIKSVYEVINKDMKTHEFFTTNQKLLAGVAYVNETLNGITYHLKPESFFQLNTLQAEKLYETVIKLAELSKHDVVVDAYTGAGPMAFYMAPHVKKVYAIELNKESFDSLQETIKENNFDNIEALNGDVKTILNRHKITSDLMVFDPPRTGLGKAFTDFLIKYKPKKLIYVSCNPSTLAKDLNELLKVYDVKNITPIDMFPHTSHVESITVLERK